MGSSKGGGGSTNIPKPPPLGKSYQQGVDVYLKNAPALLNAEQKAANTYDPLNVAHQQGLQSQFGPTQYNQQLGALNQLDSKWLTVRNQLANHVNNDLANGSRLDANSINQIQQAARGAQAARGNIYGDAPAIAEAYAIGDRGQQLYQQRLANAAGFAEMPTLASQVGQISPITPNQTSPYIDQNAGFQGVNAANAAYGAQAQIAAANSGQKQSSGAGWGSTIGGVVGGIAGAYFGGPAGAQAGYGIGSGVGGGIGSSFSDRRLKTDIKKVGEDYRGVNLYSFAYKGPKHIGYMADEVAKVDPEAVTQDAVTGYMKVRNDYAPVRIE